MLYVKYEVRPSEINGKGLFLLESVQKGQIIALSVTDANYSTEREYQEEQSKGDDLMIMTAVRYVGKHFIYTTFIEDEDYINHSENPTVLYHCGICFAKKDLKPGDELTVDYRYYLAENDFHRFTDIITGAEIDGYSPKQSLLRSSIELLEILKDVSEDWEKNCM